MTGNRGTVRGPEFLTTAEAAKELGYSPRHVTGLVNRGQLAATRIGNRLRFRPEDLEAFKQTRNRDPLHTRDDSEPGPHARRLIAFAERLGSVPSPAATATRTSPDGATLSLLREHLAKPQLWQSWTDYVDAFERYQRACARLRATAAQRVAAWNETAGLSIHQDGALDGLMLALSEAMQLVGAAPQFHIEPALEPGAPVWRLRLFAFGVASAEDPEQLRLVEQACVRAIAEVCESSPFATCLRTWHEARELAEAFRKQRGTGEFLRVSIETGACAECPPRLRQRRTSVARA